MPTYSYRCPACGRKYDRLQKMSDSTRAKCPDCGTPGERLISAGVGFIFKGAGFYETDYKRKGDTPTKHETGGPEGSDKKETATAASSESDATRPKDKPKDVAKDKPGDKPKTGAGP